MLQGLGSAELQLQPSSRCQAVSEGMALFLDWQQAGGSSSSSGSSSSNSRHEEHVDSGSELGEQQGPAAAAATVASAQGSNEAVVSSSSGSISRVQLREAGMEVVAEWQAHDLEAWTAVYDLHQVGWLARVLVVLLPAWPAAAGWVLCRSGASNAGATQPACCHAAGGASRAARQPGAAKLLSQQHARPGPTPCSRTSSTREPTMPPSRAGTRVHLRTRLSL